MNTDCLISVMLELESNCPIGNYDWALTGGAAMQIRGFPHKAKDIDILSLPNVSKLFSYKFRDRIAVPLERRRGNRIESLFMKLILRNVEVEIMSDVENKFEDGEWRPHSEWINHICPYVIDGYVFPLLSLSYELQISQMFGLKERCKMISNFKEKELGRFCTDTHVRNFWI